MTRQPLCEVEGEPSGVIAGCVNVITGSYSHASIDLTIPGPRTLTFQRTYCSSAASSTQALGNGWTFNHPTLLSLGFVDDSVYAVTAPEPTGSLLVYLSDRRLERKHKRKVTYVKIPDHGTGFNIHKWDFEDGLTNTASGEISGRTNIQNQSISYHQPEQLARLHLCNGGIRIYKHHENQDKKNVPLYLRLEKDIQPDGNCFIHEYDKYSLSRVLATNSTGTSEYGRISFSSGQDPSRTFPMTFQATSNDGRRVLCHCTLKTAPDEKQPRAYITKAVPPNGPYETYHYDRTAGTAGLRIKRKELPDNRYLCIDYYGIGDNWVGDKQVHVKPFHKADVRSGRVSRLTGPIGHDQTEILAHRFFYHHDFDMRRFPEYHQGHTEVRDAYNHRTLYRYVLGDRLTHIEHYGGTSDESYIKYSTDRLFWGQPRHQQHGDLICRALLEADDNVRSCRYLQYDRAHNVTAEHIFGNLTGANAISPTLDSNGIPQENGCECYTIRRTYSDDKFHLKLTETLPNGCIKKFQYKPNTDLLEATYVCDGDHFLHREFREYDGNATLIKTVEDNGSGMTCDDTTNVSLRKITYVTPKKSAPCLGLPENVANYYYDSSTHSECSLGRTQNVYSLEGYITNQDHYDADGALRYTLHREYDHMGNIVLEQNALQQLIERVFDANGNKVIERGLNPNFYTEHTYDFSNRLVAEEQICIDGQRFKQSYRYDYLGNRIASIDLFGNETTYTYDDLGRLTRTTLPPCPDADGNLVRHHTSQEYDIAGNIIAYTDVQGNVTRKQYNIRGQPTQIQHPDGTLERFEYNLDGTLRCQTSPNGTTTHLHYDVLGNITRKETFSIAGELLTSTTATYRGNLLTSETDACGKLTTFTYDGAGRPLMIAKAGSWSRFEYDPLGRKHKTIQWTGPDESDVRITVTEFDLLNRPIEERIEDANGQIYTRVQTQYDQAGNITAVTTFGDSGPATTQTFYNAYGKPCKIIDAEGNETHTHYNFGFRNEAGLRVLQVTTVDPLGNQTIVTHDTLGRTVASVRKDILGQELALSKQIYDSRGKLIRRIDTIKALDVPDRELIIEWQYDAVGHVICTQEAVATPQSRSTFYTYNNLGQKVADILADGTIINYQYDALGRLEKYHASDGTVDYRYTYDASGNIVAIDDEVHATTTRRTYDDAYRLTKEELGNGLTLTYQYDGLGRISAVMLPDQSSVTYGYNAMHLTEVNRIDASNNTLYTHHYLAHDQAGHVTRAQMIGPAGEITYRWDHRGRLRHLQSQHFEEEIPQGGYDPAGNLLKRRRRDAMGDEQNHYTFDPLYQLVREQAHHEHTYSYDSLNNRLSKDTTKCLIDPLNQLLQQGEASYRYDGRGNRIYQESSDGTIECVYDALGRLTHVNTKGYRWKYAYDAFNRRLSKTSYDSTDTILSEERYLYHEQMEIGAVDCQGTIVQFRALGKGLGAEIGAAVAIELDGIAYAPIHDHSGHVVMLINTVRNHAAEIYHHTAFGEEKSYKNRVLGGLSEGRSPPSNPWRFASKRHDLETGWINFGRRYFDPETGRWTTPDPRGFEDGPNLYAYVHNSPLTHIDIYGLCTARCSRCGRPIPDRPSMTDRASQTFREVRRDVGDGLAAVGHHLVPIAPFQRAWTRTCRAIGGQGFTLPAGYLAPSAVYMYAGTGGNSGVPRVFVNGICNSLKEAWGHAMAASERNDGAPVVLCYNSTHGFVGDILECVAQIAGIRTHSVEVCEDGLRIAAAMAGPSAGGGHIVVEAHSQGGLILDRGSRNIDHPSRMTTSQMGMIDVITAGSAKAINNPHLGSSTNIVDRVDLIPLIADPFNYWAARIFGSPNHRWVGSHFGNPVAAHGLQQQEYQFSMKTINTEIMRRRRED